MSLKMEDTVKNRTYPKRPFAWYVEKPSAKDYLLTVFIFAVCTLIGLLFQKLDLTDTNIVTIYILGVLITSIVTDGYLCSVAGSFLSVFLFCFFLTEPRMSFETYAVGYPVTFFIMPDRCVSCGACVKGCDKLSVDALKMDNYRIVRNEEKCVGCGVCVTKCPTRAWTRSEKKYYRLTLMGRTGKKNPRLGEDFLIWADEDTIVKVILNTYKFVKKYIDPSAPGGKEHVGYIIDRVGFAEYKRWALDGVVLPQETIVKDNIYWSGIHYR